MNKRSTFLAAAVISALLIGGCNRPEGGFRNRLPDEVTPTPSGPIQLPEIEAQTPDESTQLLNEMDQLLNEMEMALYAELEWQPEVPDDTGVQLNGDQELSNIVDLLDQLENSLQTLDNALASEDGQQLDPP